MKLSVFVALLALFAFSPALQAESPPRAPHYWVFVGTYTGKKSQGIYKVLLDSGSGKFISKIEVAAETTSPSFLAIHPKQTHLFAVGEISNFKGGKGGGVSSFTLDPSTGNLKLINQQSSVGSGPCHITCDAAGKNVLVANYGGGSTTVLPFDKDGKLGEPTAFVQHKGSSVNKGRQEAPHAHSVNLDAANRFAFVADLGLDKVMIYKYDSEKGTITANDPASVDLAPGDGPRHFAFHPNGKFAYVNNELTSSLTAMAYDAEKGSFKKLNTLSTLPKETKGNSTAETVVHPNGKFVYTSNRGHNSIASFEIAESGEIKAIGHQGAGVNVPRNFNIDPSGQWMIVANQAGDSIIVLKIDPKTGQLTPTDQKAEVGSPVCIKFVRQP